MGPCGDSALYETYLSKGELYHCGMAAQIQEWAKSQDIEYCTFGFGELPPPANSTNFEDYVYTDAQL